MGGSGARSALTPSSSKPDPQVLSGLTVAVMQVPESVAFSFVAGVPPIVGLYSTVVLGLVTALFGGRPGMISGAAGAMAVVAADLTRDDGPLGAFAPAARFEMLLMCVLLTGLLQAGCGLLQLAKLVRLIPRPAMLGFMNGLAIVIFAAQLSAFTECDSPAADVHTDCEAHELTWLPVAAARTWLTLALVALTMGVMLALPRCSKRAAELLPPSLVAIVLGTVVEHALFRARLGVATRTVGDTAAIDGALPQFHLPDVPADAAWGVIAQYAVSLCLVGLIESVMTLQAVDEITDSLPSSFRSNQECVAQGVANALCGVLGAMGGDAMIGQSTINVMNGARGRLSGAVAAVAMLCFILALSPVIELVPVGTLTGVLFVVVLNTFHWPSFRALRSAPRADALVLVQVTLLAVATNLAVGVIAGVATLAACDAWRRGGEFGVESKALTARPLAAAAASRGAAAPREDDGGEAPTEIAKVYRPVGGPLFFAAATTFTTAFTPARDPRGVAVDFSASAVADYSALSAIDAVAKRYHALGKTVELWNLSAVDRALARAAPELCRGVALVDRPGAWEEEAATSDVTEA